MTKMTKVTKRLAEATIKNRQAVYFMPKFINGDCFKISTIEQLAYYYPNKNYDLMIKELN